MRILSIDGWAKAIRQRSRLDFYRRADGAVAVEFALIAAPFFALVIAILDLGLIFTAQAALETATEESARLVLTGQAATEGLTASTFKQTVCSRLPGAFTCGGTTAGSGGYTMTGVMVDLETATAFSSANTSAPTLTYSGGNVTNVWQFQAGSPGSIEVMRVMYQWPVFPGPLSLNFANLSNGTYLLMATAVFRNEPQ